jgi:quercetin dioxygenase-like cupin family protein
MRIPSFLAAPALALLAIVTLLQPTAAQYSRPPSAAAEQIEWQNSRVRLHRLDVNPGASIPVEAGSDRVLVYLTANQDGAMPPAEAVWQPAGSGELQNRGTVRFEAIAIDLKGGPGSGAMVTPPEALSTSYRAEVERLIDNPRVLVTKHRYEPATYVDPLHFHSDDVVVIYLRGGYTFAPAGQYGWYHVQRGEFDVIPANTLHTLGNAGSDPLEFLVIMPR